MFLKAIRNSFSRLRALRDMRALEKRESVALRVAGEREVQRAQLELAHGRRANAEQIWLDVCRNFPHATMSRRALDLLLNLGRYEELDKLVSTGLQKEPHRFDLLEISALAAKRRGRNEEAINFYRLLQRQHPALPTGALGVARCMTSLGRYDEAEGVLSHVRRRFLDDKVFRVEDARLAVARQDWASGLERWSRVWRIDDNVGRRIEAALAIARCQRESGNFAMAESCLVEARDQYSAASQLWIDLAETAESKDDWAAATNRWADVYLRFPSEPAAYLRGACALVKCGREHEAAALIRSAAKRFPSDSRFEADLALLGEQKLDQLKAVPKAARRPSRDGL